MKKRMILALVLVFALLCLACSHDADDGTSESSLTSEQSATSESSASSSVSSADGTSSADETSTGTESGATSSDASTSSKPTEGSENSESSTPAENSKPTEGSENSGSVDTSSSSGNPNPSQTGHKHEYVRSIGKPSTCTEDGYMVYTCSCGDSYKGEVLWATGHFLTESITKEPTGTERGTIRYRCSNRGCDYEETREIYSWNEVNRMVGECVVQYINEYRVGQGLQELKLSQNITEFATVRSAQLAINFSHDPEDQQKAHNATRGVFSCAEVIWGSGAEYCKVGTDNIDNAAKAIVTAFHNSQKHWDILMSKTAEYIGVGCIKNTCINVSSGYPGETPDSDFMYKWCDENGEYHEEWVEFPRYKEGDAIPLGFKVGDIIPKWMIGDPLP